MSKTSSDSQLQRAGFFQSRQPDTLAGCTQLATSRCLRVIVCGFGLSRETRRPAATSLHSVVHSRTWWRPRRVFHVPLGVLSSTPFLGQTHGFRQGRGLHAPPPPPTLPQCGTSSWHWRRWPYPLTFSHDKPATLYRCTSWILLKFLGQSFNKWSVAPHPKRARCNVGPPLP